MCFAISKLCLHEHLSIQYLLCYYYLCHLETWLHLSMLKSNKIIDLSGVTSKVATSLREAEVTIQSSLTELSAEISDDDRGKVLRQLGMFAI